MHVQKPHVTIRPERDGDVRAIHAVHSAAFTSETEARLVDLLRERGKAAISLVAQTSGTIVGHVLFSPVTIDGRATNPPGVGLGPVAVLPEHQRKGIGAALINAGIDACREPGFGYVVVLGDSGYYPRFGFRQASERNLRNEYGVDEPFMVQELQPHTLPKRGGLVRYAPEFSEVGA